MTILDLPVYDFACNDPQRPMQTDPLQLRRNLSSDPAAAAVGANPQRVCQLYTGGVCPYGPVWAWQRSLVAARKQTPTLEDVLLLLEHPPVYTLGTGSDPQFLKFDPAQPPADLVQIERGGEVTYHCPGQLVGYPILNLQFYRQDLHWYLRQLEAVLLRVLAAYGLAGDRLPGLTGVWVEGHKVAAIGIKVSRWITMHGFALNVTPDLAGFQQIVPCGIGDRPVGSLAQFCPGITLAAVRQEVAQAFATVFDVTLRPCPWPSDLPGGAG